MQIDLPTLMVSSISRMHSLRDQIDCTRTKQPCANVSPISLRQWWADAPLWWHPPQNCANCKDIVQTKCLFCPCRSSRLAAMQSVACFLCDQTKRFSLQYHFCPRRTGIVHVCSIWGVHYPPKKFLSIIAFQRRHIAYKRITVQNLSQLLTCKTTWYKERCQPFLYVWYACCWTFAAPAPWNGMMWIGERTGTSNTKFDWCRTAPKVCPMYVRGVFKKKLLL